MVLMNSYIVVRVSSNSSGTILFLLYVSMMLIITFLQQEFALLPELQNLDIVGEDAKAQLLERYQRMRWLSFFLVPVLLVLRLLLVSLCLFIGSFFFTEMSGKKFKDWWGVATIAQAVMLSYIVVLCIVNIAFGANMAMDVTSYTSLLFLGREDIEPWVRMPLAAMNVFEILYWIVMALCVGKLCGTKFWQSFKFVMSSYGVGYLFYIALLMFLMLYLT